LSSFGFSSLGLSSFFSSLSVLFTFSNFFPCLSSLGFSSFGLSSLGLSSLGLSSLGFSSFGLSSFGLSSFFSS